MELDYCSSAKVQK